MTKEKNQAELEIEALADVFNIASEGFEEFFKKAEESKKGNSSTAASSGDNSKAASSGDYSKAASSGDNSTAASSGYSSTAASSGYSSTAASSGDNSTAASFGNSSTAASSGDNSTAASSGDNSGCAAIGYRAAVKGDLGNLLMASEYIIKDGNTIPVGGKADLVDGKKLKAGCWYIVEKGEWVEVDLTDGVFAYVLSNKKGVKKVKTESGSVLFVVSDDFGNSAHGDTVAKAREDLIYKVVERTDVKIPESATGKEWIGIYRAVTGACAAGVKDFVTSTGRSLDDVYSAKEIAALVKGNFGADAFAKKMSE